MPGATRDNPGGNLPLFIAAAASRLRSSRDWRDHIGWIIDQLGHLLQVSRVYLFQIHELGDGGFGQTCTSDWATPGLKPLTTDARKINERILETDPLMLDWAERRRRGEMIEGHTRDLTGYVREDFEYQEIKSYITFPIWVNGHWWGHIGLDDCVRERQWRDEERATLRTVAYLLGDAVELSASSLVMSEATRVAMLNAAPDGIVVVDEMGAILEFNPAAEAIFGVKRGLIIGRPVVTALIPSEARRAFNFLRKRLVRGKDAKLLGQRTETEGLHAAGVRVPLELAITEIRQGGRRLFVCYVRDLTERKRTEAEVARQRDALHQSEKMTALGSLLAGVAHELNNPLSVVIGRAVMLEEDATDPIQRERLKRLREAAERCAKVSKTFLAMARQSPAVRAPMRLDRAIHSALDLVAYSLRSSGITVTLDLDDDLPEVTADLDQMVQVFVNLFVNAEHAMRGTDGKRVLAVSTAAPAHGAQVVATVRDSGSGIRPDILPRIFEPFFTTKAVGLGTGMGLAVSFGMIAAHGGRLEASSPPDDVGAVFTVALPLGVAKPRPVPPAVAPAPAKPQGRRVLVVDDEPEVAALLQEILERAGHATDRAENGLEALDRARRNGYDAIFCDLRMPVMDGRTLRRRIVEVEPRYAGRMAFITGDLLGEVKMGDTLDGCPLIEKPFHKRAILDMLAKIGGPP